MRKSVFATLALCACILWSLRSEACTNVLVTPGASTDGSSLVSYAADSHWLYGELAFRKAGKFAQGSRREVIEWDTYVRKGDIAQAESTLQRVGNMNTSQLIIAETTWGGRLELMDTTGVMDYGSMIYIALERARTAREAIQVMTSLANEYGYPSEGETFSIADPEEVWIMDLIGKGSDNKGVVWVARRVPDGYICAHANQARIRTFPLDDPENCLYSPDVISFAREKGYFTGDDKDFSFREAYCPLDFGTVRGCDARAWSAFNILCDGVFTWEENGEEHSAPAESFLNYAMGYDLAGELPLFVKPSRKISVKDVADVMRDHFEGTPMDMRTDAGAGSNACPYRWRPLTFEWEGKSYVNERAIATQQTGFWFVGQARGWLPEQIGALIWFGTDDAATSYLNPIYVGIDSVPECLAEGNGNLLEYSPTSSFWLNNRISNACYKMYNRMEPYVRERVDAFENTQIFSEVPRQDSLMLKIYNRHPKGLGARLAQRRIRKELTKFTVKTAQDQFAAWTVLEQEMLVKFMDGNVKAQNPDGSFKHTDAFAGMPDGLEYGGQTDKWKEATVKDHGPVLEEKN